jgi:hypothetical protein
MPAVVKSTTQVVWFNTISAARDQRALFWCCRLAGQEVAELGS